MVSTQPESFRRRRTRSIGTPSIGDVAKVAGVSAQTVSRVSTDYPGVRPHTREKVLAAMRSVGYVPNSAARALKSGSFRTIGVVAHQLARTGESRTVEAVVEAARREGFAITLVDVQSPTSQEVSAAVASLASVAIDGLIIIRAENLSPDSLTLPPQLPVVVSDSQFAGRHPAVATDQRSGTQQAVGHLLGLGHSSVAHIGGPDDSLPAQEREQAWRDVLDSSGAAVAEVLHSDWSAESGYRLGKELVPQICDRRTTAVFCANDQVALGLYRAVYESGLSIPEDVSVIGFDNIPETAQYWPPLTSVAQDFHQIGTKLIELLTEQIDQGTMPSERLLLPVHLVERASTAPPPAG